MRREEILSSVAAYYSRCFGAFGPTPAGVDWNSEASQRLRFEELLHVRDQADVRSLNDWGCGWGALVDYLDSTAVELEYAGLEVSDSLRRHAESTFGSRPNIRFVGSEHELGIADVTIASGIFNVRGDIPDDVWHAFAVETVDRMAAVSRRGFSFNVLSAWADAHHMRADLHYADPAWWLDHCRRYSRKVAVRHDTELYEFSVIVRL